MDIRKTCYEDLPRLEEIYAAARAYMKETGNPAQWGDSSPDMDTVRADIAKGQSYVCLQDGRIVGTFCFFVGEEPTYRNIREGEWKNGEPYGVIHRVASDGTARGIADACFAFCWKQHRNLRIDTHRDNAPMRRAIARGGFSYCGLITVEDGSERLAFQRV